jgi:RimJ/RimL family protein N-acetyltransferase/ADP-ribose pyrophosphatase YjhB (NUDIX family)
MNGCMSLEEISYRPPTLTTERLVLRGFEPSDEGAVHAYASDEETTRYMLWERHRSLDDTRTFLDAYLAIAYAAGVHEYAICLRDDPRHVIGSIGLRRDARHQSGELGYILHRNHWGKGLVVEAARALIAHGFESERLVRIEVVAFADNARSRRVPEKLGFQFEGVSRSALCVRGQRRDLARYGLLRTDAFDANTTAPWLRWAREIAAVAQTGLTFVHDPFDRERYARLRELSLEIFADALSGSSAPVSDDVRAQLLAGATGYATPKLDVRAAVFREDARGVPTILLVKERSDGLWTLPGGWVDVGESPSYAVQKEVREESGFLVRPEKLIALLDRDRQGHPASPFHVWKAFLRCAIIGGSAHEAGDGLEIDDVAFFAADALPALSLPRVLASQIALCFAHHAQPDLPTQFD